MLYRLVTVDQIAVSTDRTFESAVVAIDPVDGKMPAVGVAVVFGLIATMVVPIGLAVGRSESSAEVVYPVTVVGDALRGATT